MRSAVIAGVLLAATTSSADTLKPRSREPAMQVVGGEALRSDIVPTAPAPTRHAARGQLGSLAARGWRATWDRATGVPRQLWGSYLDAPGATLDPAIAERTARAVLAAHLALLAPGAAPSDLELAANRLDDGIRTVGFRQTWHGLRVVGGQLSVVIRADRLFVISSSALPDVAPASPPSITSTARRIHAETWLASEIGQPIVARQGAPAAERVVLPIVRDGVIEYRVATVVELDAVGRPGRWDVYVGDDGAPIARANKLRFTDGTLLFNASVRWPGGVRQDFPAVTAELTVDTIATLTDVLGGFSWTAATAATVVPSLIGTLVNVTTQTGATATGSLTAQPGQPVVWNLATSELDDAQLDSYVYATIAKANARRIVPAIAGWLDQQLAVVVNQSEEACNAYSTGDDLHFFVKTAECENTGRLADVVFHEFGHSMHNHAVIPGTGVYDPELSEGLGDFNAANIVEDHNMGIGFFLTDKPLRDIDPPGHEYRWPEDRSFDPHISGLVIGGALWDLRKLAIGALGHDPGVAVTETIFRGILQRAADIPTSYVAALVIDDDNGNLGDGTPHGCLIGNAFAPHGLAPSFVTTTIGTPTLAGLTISVPVTVPPTAACPPPQPASATIAWKRDGDAGTVPMVLAGGVYTGTIPPQPDNSVVHYTVAVTLDNGLGAQFPDNPADPEYTLFTGTPERIYCATMDADPTWTTTGDPWQWGTPDAPHPDPMSTHTGTNVLGTTVHGSGLYRNAAMTRIETPAIDVSRYEHIRLQYYRWLTTEDSIYDTAAIEANGTMIWKNASDHAGTLNHLDREWRFQDFDVTPQVADGKLAVAWTLVTDTSGQFGGWTLDDVCIVGIGLRPGCGNGVLDPGEECEDSNTVDGDGCAANCVQELEPAPPVAGCCGVGTAPTGPVLLSVGVLFGLVVRRRRPR